MKYLLLFLIISLTLFSCKKETDTPSGGNKIEIGETIVDTVSYFSAKVESSITDIGGNSITQHGHCWSKKDNPNLEDSHTSFGKVTTPKSFSSVMSDLDPNTTYYFRAYFVSNNETIYGEKRTIKTLKTGIPVAETGGISDLTINSVTCSGSAIADSGLVIIQKGICWSKDSNPDLNNNIGFTEKGGGVGSFSDNITELEEGNTYYILAYATNEKGTGYGEIRTFQTISITLPTVSTSEVTEITTNSAECGGEVTNDGDGTVTTRGVCWNTNDNPTLENNVGFTTDGSGMGSFTSSITNLTENTTYYVAAYASNEKGVAYGQVRQFVTKLLEWVDVEGGTFQMGSDEGDDDEMPIHTVTLDSYKICKYEVTNSQFSMFLNDISCNSDGFYNDPEYGYIQYIEMNDGSCQFDYVSGQFIPINGKENFPVIEVSWYGVNAFAQWSGGRLPTEAEWEFAARGGNERNGYIYSGSDIIGDVAWYGSNSGGHTHQVGSKVPNELGIYDMSGNVWEWCEDWYDSNYYSVSPQFNPPGPSNGVNRVLRGGSWTDVPHACRVADRLGDYPVNMHYGYGFRIVKEN